MDELEAMGNWASDQDAQWWPFGFLRPEPHQWMSNRRVLALAVLYGSLAGSIMNVLARLTGTTQGIAPWALPAAGVIGFFVFYRATFAFCWNRRAARIRSGGR